MVSISVPGGCDHSWLEYQGHCYKIFHERHTWAEAREICRTLHGDLVLIQDDKKQKFVYENFAVGKTLWIGLRRKYVGGAFKWVDGTDLEFENWVPRSPDTDNEECGEMTDYEAFKGKWNDNDCSRRMPYICEQEVKFNDVFKVLPGKIRLGHEMDRFQVASEVQCVLRCQRLPGCESINFVHRTAGSKNWSLCELNRRANGGLSTENLHADDKYSYSFKVDT